MTVSFEYQFGFSENNSFENEIKTNIIKLIDMNIWNLCNFIYISMTFDFICHSNPLKKLKYMGFRVFFLFN